jgi:hypothetical protein
MPAALAVTEAVMAAALSRVMDATPPTVVAVAAEGVPAVVAKVTTVVSGTVNPAPPAALTVAVRVTGPWPTNSEVRLAARLTVPGALGSAM